MPDRRAFRLLTLPAYRSIDRDAASSIWAADEAAAIRIAEKHFERANEQIIAVIERPAVDLESGPDTEVRYARRDPSGAFLGFEARPETAERLDLLPHPEGGWYRRTWESAFSIDPDGYSGSRPAATAIHFLLRPGEQSRWHAVRSDELYFWHSGGPLAMRLGGTGSAPDESPARMLLGPDLAAGHRPQLVIPGGTWQAAQPAGAAEVLISCVVSPGFDFADFRVV